MLEFFFQSHAKDLKATCVLQSPPKHRKGPTALRISHVSAARMCRGLDPSWMQLHMLPNTMIPSTLLQHFTAFGKLAKLSVSVWNLVRCLSEHAAESGTHFAGAAG